MKKRDLQKPRRIGVCKMSLPGTVTSGINLAEAQEALPLPGFRSEAPTISDEHGSEKGLFVG
jgi:hypothetical protein